MADIFISYSHDDHGFVRRMVPALEAEGFSVWWDHTIPPGQSWDSFIARGIKEAKVAIVVWSQTSVASEWVKEEASIARGTGKYLPVQIDSADPPIGFSRIQAAQLVGWDGNAKDPQWLMLMGEVRRIMAEGGVVTPSPRRGAGRTSETTETAPKKGLPIAAIVAAFVLIGGVGAAGYFYLNQGGASSETQAAASGEVAELRRQMEETQAALAEERRLREETESAAKARSAPPTQAAASTPQRTTAPQPPTETAFERRDRIEREVKATGIEGGWYILSEEPVRDRGTLNVGQACDGTRLVVEGDQLRGWIAGSWDTPGGGGSSASTNMSAVVQRVNGDLITISRFRTIQVGRNELIYRQQVRDERDEIVDRVLIARRCP